MGHIAASFKITNSGNKFGHKAEVQNDIIEIVNSFGGRERLKLCAQQMQSIAFFY